MVVQSGLIFTQEPQQLLSQSLSAHIANNNKVRWRRVSYILRFNYCV